METSLRRLPKSQVEVTLTLSADEVNRAFDRVYRELAANPIPGFRPGKAPRVIIRRRFGEEHIRSAVLSKILDDHLPKAVEEVSNAELRPLGEPVLPDIEDILPAEGQPLTIPVVVAVYPTPTFDELAGIKLLRPVAPVTDQDVDRVVSEVLDAHADWQEVSRAIAPGDRVELTVERMVDGKIDFKLDDEEVIAASPQDEEQHIVARKVVGHLPGQTVEFDYDIPADSPDDAAGKQAHYKLVIQRVFEKKLPELTDDFVKENLGAETVEDLRARIRQELENERERKAFEALQSQVIASLLARSDIELPDVLVEAAVQDRLDRLEQELGKIGIGLAELAEMRQVDPGELVEQQHERTVLMLETKIALEALAEREGLEAEEQDIEAEIEDLARRTNQRTAYIRQAYEVQEEITERIDNAAKTRRVIRWLIEQADIEDVPADQYEERVEQLLRELHQLRKERRERAAKEAAAYAEKAQTEAPVQELSAQDEGHAVERDAERSEPPSEGEAQVETADVEQQTTAAEGRQGEEIVAREAEATSTPAGVEAEPQEVSPAAPKSSAGEPETLEEQGSEPPQPREPESGE
ncbi:MAG: trigger factor [Armatimonadetes bacterium]|nr:trigger factor [Armatimonadota bacterium]